MTITLPQICISFDGFGTVIAVAFIAYIAGYWHKKIKKDRYETIDQSKRDAAAWQANCGLAMGEPVLVNRIDARETLWKPNPYKEASSFDPMQWAA